MTGGKTVVIIAEITWLLLSPVLCRGGAMKALEIYAAAAADNSGADMEVALEQPIAKPAVVNTVPELPRGFLVVNRSGIDLEYYVEYPDPKLSYGGHIPVGQEVFLPCPRGFAALVFKGADGYLQHIEHSFSQETSKEVYKVFLLREKPSEPKARSSSVHRDNKYGYLDVFVGQGAPHMNLEFSNPNQAIHLSQLGLSGPVNGPYRSVKWDKLKTEGYGLGGIRFGGYGSGNLGGALELSMEKRNIKRQITAVAINEGSPKKFTFYSGDYLTVTSFYLVGNVMFRFPKRRTLEPYLGVGMGLSFNRIQMPHVGGLHDSSSYSLSAPTNISAAGFVFNVPCGMRIQLTEKTQVVAEVRYQVNTILFDRGGIIGEKDTLTVRGLYFNLGMGFNF